jgi:hypothetical protein
LVLELLIYFAYVKSHFFLQVERMVLDWKGEELGKASKLIAAWTSAYDSYLVFKYMTRVEGIDSDRTTTLSIFRYE